MSEKRFELRKYGDSWEVYDNETFECYTIHNVSGLLNEQQATIEQLQDLCGESDSENAKLRIENKRLEEENEKLRKELDDE